MTKQQEKLVEDNLGLVYYTVNKFYPSSTTNEDVIQIGMVGLCKAAIDWDAEKGVFSSYAVQKIRGEICGEFRKEKRRIKTLSLDYIYDGDDDDGKTLQDYVIGDEDEGYVDLSPLYDRLTPKESRVLDLLQTGMTITRIGKEIGVSHQRVTAIVRQIRKKWRVFVSIN